MLPSAAKTASKLLGVLGIPIADQETEWRRLGEVASLLGHPRCVRNSLHVRPDRRGAGPSP